MLKLSDEVVRKALEFLRDPEASLTRKLENVAAWLDCSPSLPGVCEAVSCRLLCPCSDDPSVISERYCCRLCVFSCQNLGDLKQHIVSSHCVRPLDAELAFVEYRKKILAMVEHAGPMVPGMSRQRAIAANFDQQLRCPVGMDGGRAEGGCVVCARRFWLSELYPMVLFQSPEADLSTIEVPSGAETIAPSQQQRLCRLLGIDRYAERWPHIDRGELQASAVEHPYIPGEFLLLHRRRMPASSVDPCPVCRNCRLSLKSSILTLPRHALANDLWMGRVLPELSNLSPGTKRLLPIVRVCMQVTVLQPLSLPRDERQKGYIGNTIFLPQAGPGAIQATLPPKDQDMAENILFVLVGQKKEDLIKSSKLLQAPRGEYVAAVESYLARELLQKGPADAQGQAEEEEEGQDERRPEHGAGSSEDAVLRIPAAGAGRSDDAVLRNPDVQSDSGHLVSSIVGLNDDSDDGNRWLRMCRDVEDLCRRKPVQQYYTDAESVLRNRAQNDLEHDRSPAVGLLGREGAQERLVLRRVQRVQSLAKGVEQERRAQGQMFEVRPQKLVVPSRDEPMNMFQPATWAMAFPELFPWGDGVPFVKRETSMEAGEVFRYLLLREELVYGESDAPPPLPRWSLSAMALHGEKADIRELLRSSEVDVSLKRALGSVLQVGASVLGTEGHRSQIRLRGHAAGWHYGTSHVFVTPNLADSRASLLLQLHMQGLDGKVENYDVDLRWDLEDPVLPSLAAMRRVLAADPVSQARFFDLMMTLFLEEVLGTLPAFTRASFRAGKAQVYEDGFAASTFPGCFGDIAAFCGPLETQGRGSMHPHILIVLLGHDLGSRLRSMMARAERGELVIQLQRWREKVLRAASRIRYDSQLGLAAQLSVEAAPLPLGERQRESAGNQYAETQLGPKESDGHELATTESIEHVPLQLTGCYNSLRPAYLRRGRNGDPLPGSEWSQQLCKDYRRLVIQNHFHKCTKSCFKKKSSRGKRGCRFGCFHLELMTETKDDGEEKACMRCNVDVKYLGRSLCSGDLEMLMAQGEHKCLDACLQRLIVDMFRDMQDNMALVRNDVQFYTGEYAAKKFEISRSLLPELFAGIQRLEQEETERRRQESENAAEAAPAEPGVRSQATQLRALSVLRRLAFGMQRCVAKSNGEMAYQLLFQQEQLVSYSGYNMFFRFVPYAMMKARQVALEAFSESWPDLRVVALETEQNPEGCEVPLQEVADVVEDTGVGDPVGKGRQQSQVVSYNQKDDYVHRGPSAVLACMSLVNYSRYVRRVSRSKAGRVDFVRYFPFDEHYGQFASSLQELRVADDNVVVPMDLQWPAAGEQEKLACCMLGLSYPFPRCSGASHCVESWKCFECHVLEPRKEEGFVRCRFSPMWRHWRACMKLRKASAQERLLAGVALPYVRDLIGVREWFPTPVDGQAEEEDEQDERCPEHGAGSSEDAVLRIPAAGAGSSDDAVLRDPSHGAGGSDDAVLRDPPTEPDPGHFAYFLMWCWGKMFSDRSSASHDLPRVHERICCFLGIPCGFHYTQLTALEHMCHVQDTWLERLSLHHSARQTSSSQRRADRFAYVSKADEDGEEDDAGPVDIEGDGVPDDLEHQDAIERTECAEYAVSMDALAEVLFRDKEWKSAMSGRASKTKEALQCLKLVVDGLGGLPDVQAAPSGPTVGAAGIRRIWAQGDAQAAFDQQRRYLDKADGKRQERVNCLWLGAGGSGKTWAYTQVVRPVFRRFFGEDGFVAGAPTHAAVRLLGREARTLHKLANVNPGGGLDRRTLRAQKARQDALERRIVAALAAVLCPRWVPWECCVRYSSFADGLTYRGNLERKVFDEMSMTPSDVYHAAGYRFALQRADTLELDPSRYLQEWFGRMPIGIQLGDFLQLRPAAQRSLCEWQETTSAVDTAQSEDEEEEAQAGSEESNASELGRLLFKNSVRIVVHFTGTGRFSSCASGQSLVRILGHMRQGTSLSDALWRELQSRVLQPDTLSTVNGREEFFSAYWGGMAWEQVGRLQHLRSTLEARAAQEQLYFVQAIDKPAGGRSLTPEEASAALRTVNMTKTGYLMGMCPLFVGMKVRISCILPETLLSRELPCIVRRVELHPKEPVVESSAACVVLRYQPLGVLVEVDDKEYSQLQLPGACDVPKGHFFVRPVCESNGFLVQVGKDSKFRVMRKQARHRVTAHRGLVAFLNQPPWMKDADYALALYVMMSR
ncbi:tkt, partial [Symbiodinium necroappetens]